MRVLDLDLDFFLADCCELAPPGGRPGVSGHEPWREEQVRFFLEEHCGLRRDRPVPGRRFDTHDGALDLWSGLMEEGALRAPFTVVHVDAHSDLGIGKPGPSFVLQNVLTRAPDRRADIRAYREAVQLDEANYLLFALAFRWVDRLVNVRNPRSRRDIPEEIALRDGAGEYQALLLRSPVSALFEGKNGREPVIPFTVYADWRQYVEREPFDFLSVAQSPRYAPVEADGLLEVVGEYFRGI